MSIRIVNRIAKTELQTLFFSPIAWLLLVVFSIHIGSDFMDILREIIKVKAMGRAITFSVTAGVVLGGQGIYEVIQDSIYLYIPLLTMNLMSREYASGSDKLLYSSPVSSFEIVMGKFLSMVVCSFVFTLILALPSVFVMLYVPNADVTLILAALLSIFLLIITYCSIGLFMSSLSSYQVVAAVSTLAALAFFNFIGTIGQNSPAIREITYWLSIKGRASEMVGGLICSDDVIYFVAVTAFFFVLTVIHLNNMKTRRSFAEKLIRYGSAFCVLIFVAFLSSRPSLMTFADATYSDDRTLSKESQAVMKELKGGMTITTYVNVFDDEFINFIPSRQMIDKDRFKMYTRFKPDIKMKYVYYYPPVVDEALRQKYSGLTDQGIAREIAFSKGYKKGRLYSAEQLLDQIDLEEEKYQFVRVIKRQSGEEARLRLFDDLLHHPQETEISAAMKKMIVEPVKIATVVGHGERSIKKSGDRDYSIFATDGKLRQSMINQGFNIQEIDLSAESIPESINILLISDPLSPYSESELESVRSFIDRGGNMMVVTDTGRESFIGDILSMVGIETGEVISEEDVIPGRGTEEAANEYGGFYRTLVKNPGTTAVNMPGAVSLVVSDSSAFKAVPLLVTDSLTTAEPKVLAYAMSREMADGKEQRFIVTGDADCFSNSYLQLASRMKNTSYNFNMLPASFRWMCYNVFPVSSSRIARRDLDIHLTPSQMPIVRMVYCFLIPALIAALGAAVILRRRRY